MKARRVGFLGFDGVMALDLVGPIDAFSNAFVEESRGQTASCYEIVIIGLTNRPFTSESGVVFKPHKTITNAPALDTLIIPGGKVMPILDRYYRLSEVPEAIRYLEQGHARGKVVITTENNNTA